MIKIEETKRLLQQEIQQINRRAKIAPPKYVPPHRGNTSRNPQPNLHQNIGGASNSQAYGSHQNTIPQNPRPPPIHNTSQHMANPYPPPSQQYYRPQNPYINPHMNQQ